MKKVLLLLVLVIALVSCENKSGRRVPTEKRIYIIEYVDEDVDDIKEVRFGDRMSASQFRLELDSAMVWSIMYSEKLN